MHQGYWGEAKTLDVLERFGRFGLPLHFTETTLLSGDLMPPEIVDLNDHQVADWPSTPEGEARQADEVVRHYRNLLADPRVAAITWWDFADGQWLNAPSGLVRRDGTPKPAYDALLGLVKGDWWLAPRTFQTTSEGTFRFSGFLGDYAVSSGGRTADVRLERAGSSAIELNLG
jgi:endo-1,4-beta-xylanase